MKDTAAASGAVRLARISIYDRVAGALLNDVLYGRADIPAIAVAQLVDERSTSGRSAPLSGFEK